MRRTLRTLAAVATIALVCQTASAQYFGKNKISYETFDWKIYTSPHFDVYYYEAQEPFLEDIVSYAESAYLRIGEALDHELRFRVPMIVYKTHQEFRQTNITLAELPDGVLAFAEPIQNRMVLPIDLPPDELYELIAHELTHIFQYSVFFEGSIGRALRSRAPRWLFEGMASYLAKDESNFDRMAIRDAVVNNLLPPIQVLDYFSYLTYRYGHALFDYIEQEHGQEGLRNFVYEFRKHLLTGNIAKPVKDAFGYDLDELNRRFNRFLRKKYFPVLLDNKSPDDYGTEIGATKRPTVTPRFPTLAPALSPSGELIAAISVPKLEADLVVLAADDGDIIRNLTKGWTTKYEQIVTEVFDGRRDVAWSPTSDTVAAFVKRENKRPLVLFDALDGDLDRLIDLPDLYETAAPAFSPDGSRVAFEGNMDGVVDLFEIDLETGEIRNLTQDDFFDTNPWYAADGRTLLYNRRIGEHWKVFSVDLEDPTRKTQLTFGPSSDIQPSISADGERVYFSSDRDENGVYNLYGLDLETGELRRYTNVVGGAFAPIEIDAAGEDRALVFVAFDRGTFRLYRMPTNAPEQVIPIEERTVDRVGTEPFVPPLQLSLDDDDRAEYRTRWSFEAPSITAGITDDGTILGNGQISFTDLFGDQRVWIQAQTVSSFSNTFAQYLNLKRRTNWGVTLFDFRDFFLTARPGGGAEREQVQRSTGVNAFMQYPLNRYYRFETSLGYFDRSQDLLGGVDEFGLPVFETVDERFATAGVAIVNDSTRFQSFGPFQGRRFRIGATYGANLGGDFEGDLLDYDLDFRGYKQLTRRSTIAWRVVGSYSAGEAETFSTFGGINQLRGYDFREFFGSRVVFTNLELRFPLVDNLRFAFGLQSSLRGFLFLDVGAAWLSDDRFWDPELRSPDAFTGLLIDTGGAIRGAALADPTEAPGFEFWDSENDRLQDGRASYGFGFTFNLLGLQLNWAWAEKFDYTRYVYDRDADTGELSLVPIEQPGGDRELTFYILYDF